MAPLFPQMLLDVHAELIVDLFAGGGGASLGIEMATGRSPDVAINHDAAAVQLHAANHPQTRHLCSDVFEVDPREVAQGRPIGLLWASPDCTFHSKARGAKPFRSKETKRRALAWVVTRWAGQVRPRVIMLENVEEFAQWGPLVGPRDAQRPDPRRRGATFRSWVRSLTRLGYQVEHRELRACDYGAPTIRKRLFLIARCDGAPIVWPEPTHGPRGRLPYRTAAECIDWSNPMLSIFATREEARVWGKERGLPTPVRPLAEATMRRVARGVKRFVLDNPKPFIVSLAHGDSQRTGGRVYPLEEPIGTQHGGGGKFGVVAPVLTHLTHHGPERAHSLTDPAPTVTSAPRGELGLVAPVLVRNQGGDQTQPARSLDEPLGAALACRANPYLAAPMLIPRYGERAGQEPRVRSIEEPSPVIVPTGNGGSLAAAFLAKHFGGVVGAPLDAAAPTVTTVDHNSLVAAHLSHQYTSNTRGGQGDPEAPLKTITTGGHAALVAAFLSKFYGQGVGAELDQPAPTATTKDRSALVTVEIQGQPYVVADIAMRMLQPRELYNAQGFHPGYVIDRGADGRRLTKTEQVRMVGNSVCPPMAAALVHANAPELVARDEVAA